jgi:TRAP-type transport system periplasmic protein
MHRLNPYCRILLLILLLPGISAAQPPSGKTIIKWELATLAPKGVGWAKHIEDYVNTSLFKVTDGSLKLKWHYGGSMGDDNDYIRKMNIGRLHGMGFTGQGCTIACPETAVLELPFLFKNSDEVDYIKKKMRSRFEKLAEKYGYVLLFWVDQDFDQIYSTKWKLYRQDVFPKTKFLTWYGPLEKAVLKKLGIKPISVSVPEIAISMRHDIIDTFIAPSIWMVGGQMFTVVKYVTQINIRYAPAGILLTKKAWDTLSVKHRQAILLIRDELEQKFNAHVRADNAKALNSMIAYGVQKIDMEAAELRQMETKCREVWYEQAGRLYPRPLLDELLGHLADFRAVDKKD